MKSFLGMTLAGIVVVVISYALFVRAFNCHIPTNISHTTNYFCNANHQKNIKLTTNNTIHDANDIAEKNGENNFESYFCRLTDFYQVIIGMLTTLIFIILALIFVYSLKMSRTHVDEALESDKFIKQLEEKTHSLLLKDLSEMEIMDDINEIKSRCQFLEKAITNDTKELKLKKEAE